MESLTADVCGLDGNAAHVDAVNDPEVRKQLNLAQMPPKDRLTPDASARGRRPKMQNGGR